LNRVFLSVGSNMGNREANLIFAFRKLSPIIKNLKSSSVYETEPMYNTNQDKFLNAVFAGDTELMPAQLLDAIHAIEDESGRNREKAGWKGPRPLDIDILLFGTMTIQTGTLTIPHPGIKERGFVLVPLVELDPATTYRNFIQNSTKFGVSYYKSSEIFGIISGR